jgi:hypothetical protein
MSGLVFVSASIAFSYYSHKTVYPTKDSGLKFPTISPLASNAHNKEQQPIVKSIT